MAELQHLVPPAALSAASSTPLGNLNDLLGSGRKIKSCSLVNSREVSVSPVDTDLF